MQCQEMRNHDLIRPFTAGMPEWPMDLRKSLIRSDGPGLGHCHACCCSSRDGLVTGGHGRKPGGLVPTQVRTLLPAYLI
jgi:hypothetical protein